MNPNGHANSIIYSQFNHFYGQLVKLIENALRFNSRGEINLWLIQLIESIVDGHQSIQF